MTQELPKSRLDEIETISLADLIAREDQLLEELKANGQKQTDSMANKMAGVISDMEHNRNCDSLLEEQYKLEDDIALIGRVIELVTEQGMRATEAYFNIGIDDVRDSE